MSKISTHSKSKSIERTNRNISDYLKSDTSALQYYMTGLSNWLLLYFSSDSQSVLDHLPKLPSLKLLKALSLSCKELQDSVVRLRENCSFPGIDRQPKLQTSERELEKLKEDVSFTCKKLKKTLEEAEKCGLRTGRPKNNSIRHYVSEVQKLVSACCSDRSSTFDISKQNDASFRNSRHFRTLSTASSANADYKDRLSEILLKFVYALTLKGQMLQDKNNYHCRVLKSLYRVVQDTKLEVNKILRIPIEEPQRTRKASLRAVLFVVRISRVSKYKKDTHSFCGMKLGIITDKLDLSIKTRNLPNLGTVFDLQKTLQDRYSRTSAYKTQWNCLISSQTKQLKVFLNDMKSLLDFFYNETMTQNQELSTIKRELKNTREENEELTKYVEDVNAYVKDLERELMKMNQERVDPQDLEEMLVELESHKRALKGLTNQYNTLETSKNSLQERYEKLLKQKNE